MVRLYFLLAIGLFLWSDASFAQSPPPLTLDEPTSKSTLQILGAKFAPIPEVLYTHLPTLPKGQGLLVDTVDENSVAEKLGLQRHDILVRYGATNVQDLKHFAGMLWATPPGKPGKLHIYRAGKPQVLNCSLEQLDLPDFAKAQIKPGGPPALNLEAEALPNDKLKITFTYYAGGSSKLQTVTCQGSVEEIETQVHQISQKQQIPTQVRELLDVALQRVRLLKQR